MSLEPKILDANQFIWKAVYRSVRAYLDEPFPYRKMLHEIAAISRNHQRALDVRRALGDKRVPPEHPLLQLAKLTDE